MSYEDQYYDAEHEAGYAGARSLVRVNMRGKSLVNQKQEKERTYE